MAFAIDQYARTAAPVRWDDLDLAGAFAAQPLSPGGLRCLRYMCDIESYTVCYLRDLLLTPSHNDPVITTFLTMWNYEEYWHGEVLADVLAAHGVTTGDDHLREVRERGGWRSKLDPIKQSLLSNIIGDDFIATHMTWGAVNEWSTHAGYASLMRIEQHPVLDELLRRIIKQETRHIAFYNGQARERLAGSRRAQRLTRFALQRTWAPVGSGVMPEEEVSFLLTYLMGGPEGRAEARRIDAKVDTLPGLGGLHLVERALDARGIPA
ncbi:MAG TPA: hypothetical protein VF661_02275 [Actinomycetales bacterium]